MKEIEDLNKAINDAAEAGVDLLKKSQMGFDFGTAHHVGYTRANASGTVSTIAAKNPGVKKNYAIHHTVHFTDKFDRPDFRHEVKNLRTDNPENDARILGLKVDQIIDTESMERVYPAPETTATGYDGQAIAAGDTVVGIHGGDERQVQSVDADGVHLDFGDGMTDEAKHYSLKPSDPEAGPGPGPDPDIAYDPQPGDDEPLVDRSGTAFVGHPTAPPAAQAEATTIDTLITATETAATGLLANAAMEPHRAEIERMISELKKNPSAGHATAVINQLKELAENAMAPSTPDRKAAKGLKTILESDDFGMTKEGGNGRVKLNADGTLTVYDSYFYGGAAAMNDHIKKWSPGDFYHNYFKEQGYEAKIISSDTEMRSRMFEGSGSVSVTLAVTPVPMADHYGVEAYGEKGLKSTPWKKTFPSSAAHQAWTEKNDAETRGSRNLEAGEAHPQSKGAK